MENFTVYQVQIISMFFVMIFGLALIIGLSYQDAANKELALQASRKAKLATWVDCEKLDFSIRVRKYYLDAMQDAIFWQAMHQKDDALKAWFKDETVRSAKNHKKAMKALNDSFTLFASKY